MSSPFFIVDAFVSADTSAAVSRGNPAAVVILKDMPSDSRLQEIAAEFNLSETAFLLQKNSTQQKDWQLRWFTPTCEVKLCGHATLAATQVLSQELKIAEPEFYFETLSGTLSASVNHSNNEIALAFPRIEPKRLSNIYVHDELSVLNELGIHPLAVYQANDYLICELENAELVKKFQPDFAKTASINSATGLTLTAQASDKEIDFVSRFFAPRMGVNEDPATGSAHCSLTVLWSHKLGKEKLTAYQASQRGGLFNLRLKNDGVILAGQCRTFARGNLN